MKAVMLLSGGMDSATLLYHLVKRGDDVTAISINYGQRHNRELIAARKLTRLFGIEHKLLDASFLHDLLPSTLTHEGEVPDGHFSDMSMKQTIVPNRNMIFLAMAAGHAYSIYADVLAIGAHAGDHTIYPDCRQPFFDAMQAALDLGNAWLRPLRLYAPFLNMSKGEIASEGVSLGVPYSLTWTCYKGGDKPCGTCGSCTERAEAFAYAGVPDPLIG